MAQVRILIADDHEAVRTGLRALLAARSGSELDGEAVDGVDAVSKAVDLKPDVAILDYGLPALSGAEATREIRARVPSVEVLIFTMRNDDELIREVFEVGARGYLLKSDAKKKTSTQRSNRSRSIGRSSRGMSQECCSTRIWQAKGRSLTH